jgi:hypothetical protein
MVPSSASLYPKVVLIVGDAGSPAGKTKTREKEKYAKKKPLPVSFVHDHEFGCEYPGLQDVKVSITPL